jgi:hypothetical protein
MTFQDFRKLTRAEPFVPFRIHLANGDSYDIPYLGTILAFKDRITTSVPKNGTNEIMGDIRKYIPMSEIVALEVLGVPDRQTA